MSKAQKAQKYLVAAHAGAVLMIALFTCFWLDAPDFVKGLVTGMLLGVIVLLFSRRMRDEFVQGLWNAGTALALFATLIASLGVELVRGFADPTVDVFAAPPLLSATSIGLIALVAFFIGFHFQLLRSHA